MTYGIFSANGKRYEEANNFYGYTNWALMGIADMVKGTFCPEKPGSFQHFMDSLGVATLVTSVCSSCTRGKVSASKNVNSSFDYSPINPGFLDMKTAHHLETFLILKRYFRNIQLFIEYMVEMLKKWEDI